MIMWVHLARVLLILALALVTISSVIGIAGSGAGAVEKLVLLVVIAGCVFVAALVSKFATRTIEGLQRR